MKAASIAHLLSFGRGRGGRRRKAARPMLLERLESRVNLAAAPITPAIESPDDAEGDSLWLASTSAPASQQIAALTTSSAAVVAAFTPKNRAWTSAVDVVVPSLPDATSLRLEATGGLTSWNGRQAPTFMPARANVRIDLSLSGQTLPVRAGEPQPDATLQLAAAATNRVAARITVAGQPARAPVAGWYAVSAKIVAPNGGPETPVTLLFSIGAVPAGSRAAAIRSVGGVGARPMAVTVGVTLAPPPAVAPIVVPPVASASGSPTAVVPPAPPAPVVQSQPAFVLPPAVNGIVEVSSDITSSVTFSAGTIYVITAEVHVRRGVTLTIDDGVEVRIRNGTIRGRLLTCRALIFDSGSSLRAQNVVFQAADDANQPVSVANNGGVFFCGGTRTATKDNVSSQKLNPSRIGSFVADSITANYLGRTDPRGGDGDGNARDDIDAVSVIGAIFQEWGVRSLTVNHSGDDGFDLTNASIRMETVRVFAPVEDGLNLSTSLLQISGRLEVDMTTSTLRDREIFDFEVDTGPTHISIAPGATVDIRGYWDNSPFDLRIDVRSSDMPRPSLSTREWYAYSGTLVKSALIFSVP
jgi:hypothetical protein